MKLQDMKMTDQMTGHEIAEHEFAGHKNARHEIAVHENARLAIAGQKK